MLLLLLLCDQLNFVANIKKNKILKCLSQSKYTTYTFWITNTTIYYFNTKLKITLLGKLDSTSLFHITKRLQSSGIQSFSITCQI